MPTLKDPVSTRLTSPLQQPWDHQGGLVAEAIGSLAAAFLRHLATHF
jgi:hypothetical protein